MVRFLDDSLIPLPKISKKETCVDFCSWLYSLREELAVTSKKQYSIRSSKYLYKILSNTKSKNFGTWNHMYAQIVRVEKSTKTLIIDNFTHNTSDLKQVQNNSNKNKIVFDQRFLSLSKTC